MPLYEEEFIVGQIYAARPAKSGREFLVGWQGYDADGDTWEAEKNIIDTSVIDSFEVTRFVKASVDLAQWRVRDAMSRQLLTESGARCGVKVQCEAASDPQVGRAILRRWRVRRDGTELPVSIDDNRTHRVVQLRIPKEDQAHIGDIVQLHAARPDVGMGAVRIKAGAAHNFDMLCVVGDVLVTLRELKPNPQGELYMGRSEDARRDRRTWCGGRARHRTMCSGSSGGGGR
jgi:hypothetical protein